MNINREEAKMCVGPGWAALIDLLYDRFDVTVSPIYVSSVKEKWGTLRIYVFNADDTVLNFIDDIEHQSGTVCEHCGNVGTTIAIRGWFQTLCSKCRLKKGDKV